MQTLTNMRNIRGKKIGSQATRDGIASDYKMMRRLDRVAGKIGNVVCKRIATPKRLNEESHLATGNEKTKKGNRVSLSKVTPNPIAGMQKIAPLSRGGSARFVSRRDIELSFHDREEIKGTVRTILAISMEPDGIFWSNGTRYELPHWRKGEQVPFAIWKIIFRATRDTLGMQKIMSREVSYDAEMEQALGVIIELASDELEDTAKEQARQARVKAMGEHFRKCMRAAYETDNSRKRKARFSGMMAFCDIVEAMALGASVGHGMTSLENACDWRKRFAAYVAEGEQALRMAPSTLKEEIETAWAMHAIE